MHTRRLALVQEESQAKLTKGPTVRVAIATRDGKAVNAHFGSATRFVVYDVSSSHHAFVETITFDDVSDESGSHPADGDDRNGTKIGTLDGVHLLVVQAIGGPVAARVVRAGIHPIKMVGMESVEAVLGKVQELLQGEPPPWLRRVLLPGRDRSMDFLDDD